MTLAEARTIKCFLLCEDTSSNDSSTTNEELSFAEAALRSAEARKLARSSTYKSKYRSMNHIISHGNRVERLFSRAKLIMTDQRKNMAPYRLESLLYLRSNRPLWNAQLLQDIMNEEVVVESP